MLPRWQGGVATAAVTALTVVLIVTDVADAGVRRFWSQHALTTDIVAGLLVLALTLLVVDQVLTRRQVAGRSRAVAAHAAIVMAQAGRCVRTVRAAESADEGDGSAADELRSYLQVLLPGAPVLLDDPVARHFLEEAQALAGQLARVVGVSAKSALTRGLGSGTLDQAIERLRSAAAPLLAVLTADERVAVTGGSEDDAGR